MFGKPMRWAVLGLLLTALVATPTVAFCGDCADTGCCCSKQGGCHKPAPPDTQRARCCDGQVAPPSVPGATPQLDPPPSAEMAAAAPAVATPDAVDLDTALVARENDPPPVALFALHAAFLI